MAVIGSPTSGFANVQPTKNYLGETLQYINEDQFRRKQAEEEKKQREAAAAAAAQKQQAEQRASVSKDANEKFKFKATENGNFNDALTDYSVGSLSDYVEAQTDYINTGNPQSLKRANNILASFDAFKQSADFMNGITEDYVKNADKKDPNSVQYWKENVGSMAKGNLVFHRDKNGQARVTVFKTDEKGNPTDVMVKDQDVISYANSLRPTENFDTQQALKEFYANNPLRTTTTAKGAWSYTTQDLEQKRPQAEDLAKVIVSTPSALRNEWQKMHGEYKTDFTDEEKKQVFDNFVKNTLGGYGAKNSTEYDYDAVTRRMAENRKAKEEKTSYGVVEIPPIYNNSNFKPLNGYQAVSVSGTKPITVIDAVVNGKKLDPISSPKLESYTVFQNANGKRQILAEVSYLDVKSSTLSPEEQRNFTVGSVKNEDQRNDAEKLAISKVMKGAEYKKAVVPMSESDALKYAKQLGFKDVNEMKDAAKGYSSQPNQPQAQPSTPHKRRPY